jgi:hypothetical protein
MTDENRIIPHEQRMLIEHLLRERISRRGICRAVSVDLTAQHKAITKRARCGLSGDCPRREGTWAPGGHRRAPFLVCPVTRHLPPVTSSERRTSWSLHWLAGG